MAVVGNSDFGVLGTVFDSPSDKAKFSMGKIELAHRMIENQAQKKAMLQKANVQVNVVQKIFAVDVEVADGDTSGNKSIDLDAGEKLVVIEIFHVDNSGGEPDIESIALKEEGADEYLLNLLDDEPIISPEWVNGDFRVYTIHEGANDSGSTFTNKVDIMALSVKGL